MKTQKIGVALGSGSARGWAHIGVMQELLAMGVRPDVVVGASAGAMVGASYAAGKLDLLEEWVLNLGWKDVFGLLDLHLDGGLIQGKKLFNFFEEHMAGMEFHDLGLPFAAIATDLESGREVWLREGPLAEAIRASISLPGLFKPYKASNGRFLLDGGLVNPVPVSLCRALGADVVIAVNLNSQIVGKHFRNPRKLGLITQLPVSNQADDGVNAAGGYVNNESAKEREESNEILTKLAQWFGLEEDLEAGLDKRLDLLRSGDELSDDATHNSLLNKGSKPTPGMMEVVATAINIMQDRITKSRMAGDPPDIILNPDLTHLGLMEFYRGAEAIEEGRAVVKRNARTIQTLIDSL